MDEDLVGYGSCKSSVGYAVACRIAHPEVPMTVQFSPFRRVAIGLSTAAVVLVSLLGAAPAANADGYPDVLSGTVTGFGGVVLGDGVDVKIVDSVTNTVFTDVQASTTTGAWVTNGLPNGTYKAIFTPTSSHYRAATSDVINAVGSPVDGIDATLDNKGAATGKVVDSHGVGIPNVTVSVVLPPADTVVNSGTTDADGNYQVWVDNQNHTDNPTYRISYASANGDYQPQWSGGVSDEQDAPGVSIADDQGDQPLVTLVAATSITGTITDNDNNPLVGASVTAYDPNGIFPSSATATTDAHGNYTIGGLGATDYNVQVTAPGYFYTGDTLDADLTTATTTTVDAQLAENGDIQGTITDSHGNPVTNAEIAVLDSSGDDVSGAETDSDGHYLANGLPYGDYTVDISEYPDTHGYTEFLSGTVSVTKTNFDKQLDHVMEVGGAISGTITTLNDSSHQPEEVIVTATSTTSSFSKYIFVTPTTGLTSTYTLDGLPTDTYTVEFDPQDDNTFASQWWKSSYSADTATHVSVTAGAAVTGISNTVKKVVQPAGLYIAESDHLDVGHTLSISTHSHTVSVPSKVTSTYQWLRIATGDDGTTTPIAKATKSTYKTTNADAGYYVGVNVTQTATGYAPNTTELFDPNIVGNAIFTSVPTFKLSGTASTGHTLNVTSKGSFSVPVTLHYYWNMNGLPVPSAWSTQTTLADPTDSSLSTNSMLLGWDDLGRGNPYDTSAGFNPPADWLTDQGDVNFPEDASNDAGDPSSHDYPFHFTQLLQPQWNGQRLSVQVCADDLNDLYKEYCKTLKVTVAHDLIKRVIPVVTSLNGVYSASAGTWHSKTYTSGTVALKYQWFRGTTAISGATKSKYTLQVADEGQVVTVHVTGSASGYTSATTYSLNSTPAHLG